MIGIYRHSFTHCDCVLVGDPCLGAEFEGEKCLIFSADTDRDSFPDIGNSPYRVYILSAGVNIIGISINEIELIKEDFTLCL